MDWVNDLANVSFRSEYYWLVVCLLLGSVYCMFKAWNDPFRNISGPPGWPILGNTLDFTASTDQHSLLLKWTKQYGRIFKYYIIFGGYRLHVSDPEIAKHVLVTNCKNYRRQDTLKKLLPGFGNGLITANGRAHAIQRKQMNPFFSLAKVQRFFPVFASKTNDLVKHWTQELKEAENQSIECDVLEKLTHLSLDVIGVCAFGYDFKCVAQGQTEESKATDTVLKGHFDLQKRSLESIFPPLKLFRTKVEDEFLQAEKCLQELINKVIHQQKAGDEDGNGASSCSNNLLNIFFSMKNESGNQLSSEEIYHQVFTFLVSGHETISLTGTWTLYLLSKYPEIQSDLRRELLEVIGNHEIRWEDLDKLKLLNNCIKESLRLYPIALTTDRTSIGSDQIGPYYIPAGTHVMIGNGTLHRDESYWKDANLFKPSRFDNIGDEESKLLPYYFLPFSRGPRMCIGYRFAMAALKVTLAKILKDFAFTFKSMDQLSNTTPEFSSISTLTLKPFPTLNLKMRLVETQITLT